MAPGQVPTNFSLLDSLSTQAVSQLLQHHLLCDSVTIVPLDAVARWLIVEKWKAAGKEITPAAPCTVAIADCTIRYALHATERDSLQRQARVELRLLWAWGVHRAVAVYHDTIARSDLAAVELPRSELTTSPVPPPPRSVWDDLVEPVVIVASVATTLLLLFTARTR
ncbi:MAG: hypothetical protein KatS3mg039_1285 [Candidatus Kapaibacterium sp.]|nr:MAG: hypothetical protein KatS3mg039_1285 [Candidatus Kapabacteria bacterium]